MSLIPPATGPSTFTNSRNILISGPSTFNSIQNNGAQAIDEGLKILYSCAAASALHDSGERFDPPNCHPNTRVAVLNEIMTWLDDLDTKFAAMWMNGPMGAGKSAIAQAIAQICYERRRLSSSFFFARSSALRNDEKMLVATLSYQMSKLIPDTRSAISSAILHDPLIFESSLTSQIDALIISPLKSCSVDANASEKPLLIIIDGLDECVNGPAHEHIIKAFVSSISQIQNKLPIPHKVLIVSRPETHIKAAFHDPIIYPSVKQLSLNELWQPDHDIKTFLDDSFAKIKCTHILGPRLPQAWPSDDDIERLVRKSSGQFIYAAVVIRFLQSPRHHPIQSLKIILDLVKGAKSQPYAELDALYVHIFSKVEDLDLVLRIFQVSFLDQDYTFSVDNIENFLQLPDGMVDIALNDLASIVQVDKDLPYLTISHASLREFLDDEARSGKLYLGSQEINLDLAICSITSLKDSCQDIFHIDYLGILNKLLNMLSTDSQIVVCEAISNMDIMGILLQSTKVIEFDDKQEDLCDLFDDYGYFIQWIFENHIAYLTSGRPQIHSKAFIQIQGWILSHFKALQFSGFDHPDGMDQWIFCTLPGHNYYGLENPSIEWLPLEITSCPDFLLCLLQFLPSKYLRNYDIFGEYSFTVDRYVSGATNLLKRLIDCAICGDHELKTIQYHLEALLHATGPPDQRIYVLIKQAMADDTMEFCDGPKYIYSYEDGKRIYWHLCTKYPWKDGKDRTDVYKYLMSISYDLFEYVDKTRKAIPDIDSIIEKITAKGDADVKHVQQ